MILDTMPANGGQFVLYEPDRWAFDWTHLNHFHIRLRELKELHEYMEHKNDEGPYGGYSAKLCEVWVAADTPQGISFENADALEDCMPYTVHSRLRTSDGYHHAGYPEIAGVYTHITATREWLESDPVIEGKHLSKRLGEDLVGEWRKKQVKTEADMEARAGDRAFTATRAKAAINALKAECKLSQCDSKMTVWGRDGTRYARKSYYIHAEVDSVWNKSKGEFIPRVYLRWDCSWGGKTSQADIMDKMCAFISLGQTLTMWESGGDIWEI